MFSDKVYYLLSWGQITAPGSREIYRGYYMTINREMQLYTVREYTEGIDEYGAIRKGYTERLSKMLIKINNQSNVEDPRYIDCDLIAITEDKTINDTNSIIYKDKLYDVKYIIPSKKYHILFLNNVG